MRERVIRVLGVLVVAFFLVGIGLGAAQDKPAQEKEKKETIAAADAISGAWDGNLESQNGTISFGLVVKLDKDKVTGDISSEQGSAPVSGTWTDGKLSLTFDYNGSPVSMTGAIKDEALSGEMNFGGQMVMSWTAKKRK